MADPKPQDRSSEMERDLHELEDHIADAEKKLEARKEDADVVGDVAGDWEGEQDRGGGDDPTGARTDAGQGAPGGSQDGPGAEGAGAKPADQAARESGEAATAHDGAAARGDDADEVVGEEAAGPT